MKHRAYLQLRPYNRAAAVGYAHRWAYGRNPAYYNYDDIGGDCTSFASQCIFAGVPVMNYTPVFGWYYIDANNKAPAWTGVPYLYNFLTRPEVSPGPAAREVPIEQVKPGDLVQLNFTGEFFAHSPVIVATGEPPTRENILIAAHSFDTDYRPLNTYGHKYDRFLHILGYYPPY